MAENQSIDLLPHEAQPLVTFALFAYNQEKYIREAVEGAFAQTYEPLEIILSDDCSTDRTFEIMEEMAAKYIGPHQIVLNKNVKNLGIGNHINHVMSLVKGELIIVAAGDDISVPERTSVIVKKWLEGKRTAMSLHSAYTEISKDGNVIRVVQNRNANQFNSLIKCISENLNVTGATHAWAKIVFNTFGPLRHDVTHEDCAIPLRSMLIGKVEYINSPLVQYRTDVGVSHFSFNDIHDELYGQGAKAAERGYIDYLQKLQDLNTIDADVNLIRICSTRLKQLKLIKSLANRDASKIRLLYQAITSGAGFWYATSRTFKYILPKTIPLQKYLYAKGHFIKNFYK